MQSIVAHPTASDTPAVGGFRKNSRNVESERELTTKKAVFVGNCQLIKLSALYRSNLTTGLRGAAYHINPQLALTETDERELAQADCVLWQLTDAANKIDRSIIPSTAPVIDVPLISAVFLWPFAGRPHPNNQKLPHLPNGPFDPELGDFFLNGLIAEGVESDEAVNRYLALDFSQRTNLDRLFELWFEAQRRRDRASGFEMLDLIAGRFREEQVFLTPHHPNLAIFKALARQVFQRMGFSSDTIDRVLATLRVSPFAGDSRPIHPFVARHFDLRWVGENQRYPMRYEGDFTFPEFVRQYVTFNWNDALAEGIHLAHGQNAELARSRLTEGLRRAPSSVTGHILLSHSSLRTGNVEAAVAAARTAVSLEPSNCHGHTALGTSLARAGDPAGAEAAFRRALDLGLSAPHASVELGRLLYGQKRFAEAFEVVQGGLAFFPHDLSLLLLSAKTLVDLGLIDEAESRLREAIAVKPTAAEVHAQLADVLTLQVRRNVVANFKALADADPGNGNTLAGLGALEMRFGHYSEAETAFRSAVKLCPTEIGCKIQLVNAIARQLRLMEALALAKDAARDHPTDPSVKALVERLASQVADEAPHTAEKPGVAPGAIENLQESWKVSSAFVAVEERP